MHGAQPHHRSCSAMALPPHKGERAAPGAPLHPPLRSLHHTHCDPIVTALLRVIASFFRLGSSAL